MAWNGLLGLGGASNPYIGLLGDTLSGVGIGLLNQRPGEGVLSGVGQGLQYANQLGQQRRGNLRADEMQKIAQQQLAIQQQTAGQQKAAFDAQQQQQMAQKAAAQSLFGGPQVANPAGFRPTGAGPMASQPGPAQPPSAAMAGMSPDQLQILQQMTQGGDPGGAMNIAAQQAFPKPQGAPDSVQEFQYAKSQGFPGGFQDWIAAKAKMNQQDASLRFGLNPVYGQDEQGNTVMMLPNTQGGVKVVTPPPGVKIAPQTQYLDTGTSYVPADKRTGIAIPGAEPIAKNVAGEASEQAQGTAQGTAAAALPAAINSAEIALQNVDQLLAPESAKGREQASGLSSWFDPRNYVAGQPGYDFKANLDKLRGGVFLQAASQLRGLGAMTEIEGAKATQAIAAMDAAQSETQFKTALEEYKKAIARGVAVAKQKATASPIPPGGNAQPSAVPPPPPGFSVVQ